MVGFLAGPFGGFLRLAGLLLGPVEPVLRLLGRGPGLRGHLVRPRLLLGVGPAPGQVGGLGGHVGGGVRHRGGFLGPFGPLLGLIGPVLRLVGPPSRPVGEFLRLLGVRPALSARRCSAALCARAASFSTACLATLYGSPVSAIRWRVAVFRALSCVMIISSRRVGPRLPAMGEWHDDKARHRTWRD